MELAALAWCKKETAHKVMDVELATAFAEILDEFLQSREAMTERVTRLRSHIDRINTAVVEAVYEVDHPQGTYSSDVLGW